VHLLILIIKFGVTLFVNLELLDLIPSSSIVLQMCYKRK